MSSSWWVKGAACDQRITAARVGEAIVDHSGDMSVKSNTHECSTRGAAAGRPIVVDENLFY